MERSITATELARNLSDVLNRVRYRDERFTIERNGEPVAILGPVTARPGVTLRQVVARVGNLAPPDDGFADDVESVQRSQSVPELPEWPS